MICLLCTLSHQLTSSTTQVEYTLGQLQQPHARYLLQDAQPSKLNITKQTYIMINPKDWSHRWDLAIEKLKAALIIPVESDVIHRIILKGQVVSHRVPGEGRFS